MAAGRTFNRNDPCPCGSGRKYKKCCMGQEGGVASAALDAASTEDVEAFLREGTALHRRGNIDAAAGRYRQVLSHEPRHAAALYYLGQVMGQRGNVEQGIGLLRQSIAVDDSRARTYSNLAVLQLNAGDAEGSLASARRAVELDPNDYLELPTHARRLLDFLDLEWNDRVLEFHEIARERYISTPSFEAVIRPVHTKAAGRWRRYAKHLAPHIPRLRRFIDEFGYPE